MTKSINSLIIFGAFGDLAERKLFPAVYQLLRRQLLDESFRVLALARRPVSPSEFHQHVAQGLREHLPPQDFSEALLQQCLARIDYQQLDFSQLDDYVRLQPWLAGRGDSSGIFYLATAATHYGAICDALASANCIEEESRVVVEKPIGYDLASSIAINDKLARHFRESQIYRIDHYLGKETVQNLLALRFANSLFESQWDQKHISHVEITVAETVGIEGRWDYFDQAGQMRDMLQSHVLQLLCLFAMDPPNSLHADVIRDEKVKVLKALKTMTGKGKQHAMVRGQYVAGSMNGKAVPGYLEEPDAVANSKTGTFVAIKAGIDNWRWSGVPFYLRTGKRMHEKLTQIVVHFKQAAHFIFDSDQQHITYNRLIIRIQPDEGISLQILTKEPGLDNSMRLRRGPLNISFRTQGESIPDAYERLLWEVIRGDQYLFVRRDEVEWAWRWCDQLMGEWEQANAPPLKYPAGSWGPQEAIALMTQDGRTWHEST